MNEVIYMKTVISTKQLTDYLGLVLKSKTYQMIIATLSIKEVDSFFRKFVNIISKYYISTFDDNIEHAEEICMRFFEYDGEDFFEDILMDRIFFVCSKQLEIDQGSIENTYKICALIYKRNKQNSFYTHCFPGAIMEDVQENGLDVSRIGLQEERKVLGKYFRTPFRIGGLYYCELSDASLSYATRNMPESIGNMLGGISIVEEEETTYEMAMRSFLHNLDELRRKGVNESEIKRIYIAGKAIIDYYCKEKKAGIAFFKKDSKDIEYQYDYSILDCSSDFPIDNFLHRKINEIVQRMKLSKENALNIWNVEINKLCKNNPELKQLLDELIRNRFSYHLRKKIISNYDFGGMADGYEVPNGSLSRKEFEILEVDVPRELHITLHREGTSKLSKNPASRKNDKKSNLFKVNQICNCMEKVIKENQEMNEMIVLQLKNENIIAYHENGLFHVHRRFCLQKNNEIYISKYSDNFLIGSIMERQAIEYIASRKPLDGIVANYKKTDIYDEEDEENQEELTRSALIWYFREKYNILPASEKKELLYEESLKYESITILHEKGAYFLKDSSGTHNIAIETVFSKEKEAPYNSLYQSIMESKKENYIK